MLAFMFLTATRISQPDEYMVTSVKKGTKRPADASDDDEVRRIWMHNTAHTWLTILVPSHQDHAGVDRLDRVFKRPRVVTAKAATDVQARLLKKQHRSMPTVVR